MSDFQLFQEAKEKREAKPLQPRLLILLRGLPGSGKSTTAKELLAKHGGNHDHVFSSDDFFIPVCYKLKHMGHVSSDKMSVEKALEIATEILDMWYKARWSEQKKTYQPDFLELKKLFDQGKYHEAIQFAQLALDAFEQTEYISNWHWSKLHRAHLNNHKKFKLAVDQGVTPIIVDNTLVLARDGEAYARYAKDAEYEIVIEEPTSPHWQAYKDCLKKKDDHKKLDEFAKLLAGKNRHGVPFATISKMVRQWHPNMKLSDILKDEKKKKK